MVMKKQSAGILLYRNNGQEPEVLIAHPGGPFFAKKDLGVWTIPKGLYDEDEDPLAAAKREYREEIGSAAPDGKYLELGRVKRKDGKTITAWAVEGNIDTQKIKSNNFEMEWPPKSGKMQKFPEVDKAAWVDLPTAAKKLQRAQVAFLESLAKELKVPFKVSEDPPSAPEQYKLF
jgi:predicted NUDIX family NTP pyrophosphohydrolase